MSLGAFFIGLAAIVLAGGILFVYFKFATDRPKDEGQNALLKMLNDNLNATTKNMMEQMNEVRRQVDLRLRENAEILQKSNKNIGERLDSAARVVNTVTDKLGRLEEANKRIYDVGKDIASLQEILRAPKLRGNLGEQFLGDLLSNIPKEMYRLQYTFKNGKTVDAVILFRDHMVPIDSKFPLENFQKFAAAKDEKEKKLAKKAFVSDVKKRIDEAAQYIMPDEGTLDFALLYIPAENVYYEVIIKDEDDVGIGDYARKKRVVPVSPNNFFVYIQTILMGLSGMQIEKGAKEMQASLARLKGDFTRFGEDFQVLGSHLNNASNKYEDSFKKMERIGTRLDQIGVLSSETQEKELLT